MDTIDRMIKTLEWLNRLAKVSKDANKPMLECTDVDKWNDVKVLLDTKTDTINLMDELLTIVKALEIRQLELKNLLQTEINTTVSYW